MPKKCQINEAKAKAKATKEIFRFGNFYHMGRNTFESEVTISINVDDLKGFVEEKMFNEFLKRC